MNNSKSDEYYIREILNGDPASYSFLVERYKDFAYSLSFRILQQREEAEETAQDAFLKAYKSLRMFKGGASFKTWFYKIVYNTAISKVRKKKKRTLPIDEKIMSATEIVETENAIHQLKKQDRVNFLTLALSLAEPEEQALLTMYYYDNLSTNEICRITGLTISNIKVKLHRARQKLFKNLKHLLKEELISIL